MAEILGHATCTLADAKSLAWMSVILVNAGEGGGIWGDGVPGRSMDINGIFGYQIDIR